MMAISEIESEVINIIYVLNSKEFKYVLFTYKG